MKIFGKQEHDNPMWLYIGIILATIVIILREIIVSGYLIQTILLIVLVIALYMIYEYIDNKIKNRPARLWFKYTKKYPIIVQYMPPKWINPAEAWLLYNLKVDPTDLTSLIYWWKYQKYIDIETYIWRNTKKEFIKLIKMQDLPYNVPVFESAVFDSIFCMWNVKVIEEWFQLRYALLLEDLEYHWIKKWWIEKSVVSEYSKNVYNILIMMFFCWTYLYLTELWYVFPKFWVILLILFFACIFFGWYMDWWHGFNFTDKWAKLASHIIWYKKFIKSCDENKIKLLLQEDPLFVDKTLPFATAFGLETEFIKKISPLRVDWNAKYCRWKKVPTIARAISLLKH